MPSFLAGFAGWTAPDLFAIAFAALLAGLVVAMRRSRGAPWLVGAAMVLVLAAVSWRSVEFDLIGWHGFMHGSTMQRLVDGAPVPPEDPAFAGGTLRYPWVEQWLMASIARIAGVNPNLETIALEILLFGMY